MKYIKLFEVREWTGLQDYLANPNKREYFKYKSHVFVMIKNDRNIYQIGNASPHNYEMDKNMKYEIRRVESPNPVSTAGGLSDWIREDQIVKVIPPEELEIVFYANKYNL